MKRGGGRRKPNGPRKRGSFLPKYVLAEHQRRLERLMEVRKLNKSVLSHQAGLKPPNGVSAWFRDLDAIPGPSIGEGASLYRLARNTGFSVDYLLGLSDVELLGATRSLRTLAEELHAHIVREVVTMGLGSPETVEAAILPGERLLGELVRLCADDVREFSLIARLASPAAAARLREARSTYADRTVSLDKLPALLAERLGLAVAPEPAGVENTAPLKPVRTDGLPVPMRASEAP